MPNYQPRQSLTWRYSTSTGNLSIVSKIYVEVAANETISSAVLPIRNNIGIITLSVNGGLTSPLTEVIFLESITAGLTNKDLVRGFIRTISPPQTIIVSFFKDNRMEGEAINTSSQNSDIEMVA